MRITKHSCISDFVFKGLPYDLKNTNYFDNWTKDSVNRSKKEVAEALFRKADIARIRKEAVDSINGWGLNRFYVMVENLDSWLKEPEKILEMVLDEIKEIGEPFDIEIEENITFKAQVIAI